MATPDRRRGAEGAARRGGILVVVLAALWGGASCGDLPPIHSPYTQKDTAIADLRKATTHQQGQKEYILAVAKRVGLPGNFDPCNPSSFHTPIKGVDPYHLREAHHLVFDAPWSQGVDVMEFFQANGLRKGHRVLEYGFGGLRNGVPLIRYLDRGGYTGVEADEWLFRAGNDYEIKYNRLGASGASLGHIAEDSDPQEVVSKLTETLKIDAFDMVFASTIVQHLRANGRTKEMKDLTQALLGAAGEAGQIWFLNFLPFPVKQFKREFPGLGVERFDYASRFSSGNLVFYKVTQSETE